MKKVIGKCVLYLRVSSKEQEKEGYSIPAQEKLLTSYAINNEFHVERTFKDIETAKKSGRTDFDKLVAFVRKNKSIKHILVEKTDRLYRNIKDWVVIEDLMNEKNISIHLIKESEIIGRSSSSHSKFIHGIKVLMAKNYIDNLSEETKKGMNQKAEEGFYPCKAPTGYINNKETKRIEIDPDKAYLVRKLFELYSTGKYSLDVLKDHIAKEGLFQNCTNKPLPKSSIHHILSNPIYSGKFKWHGKLYEGQHETIISDSLYNKVQLILHRNTKPNRSKRNFAFTGFVKCGECGGSFTAEFKKNKYTYYRCTQYKGKCSSPYIKEEKLIELMADSLKALKFKPKFYEGIIESLKDSNNDKQIDFKKRKKSLLTQKTKTEDKINQLYEDRLEGIITLRIYKQMSIKLRTKLEDLQEQLKSIDKANKSYVDLGIKLLEISQNTYEYYEQYDLKEKRTLLDCIVSNFTVKSGNLYPTYRKPFDIIAEGALRSIKLRW